MIALTGLFAILFFAPLPIVMIMGVLNQFGGEWFCDHGWHLTPKESVYEQGFLGPYGLCPRCGAKLSKWTGIWKLVQQPWEVKRDQGENHV